MKKHIVAMMYDFDNTLCTKDMQEYTFIPALNMKPAAFWEKARILAEEEGMDRILAYMHLMLRESGAARHSVRRDDFVKLGADVEYFPGVESWFEDINRLGADLGIEVQHFIISSGLKEIIEGSGIYKHFERVYACEYLYDENGVACWPKNAVNFTGKTQFLFRINKGALDLNDDAALNDYIPENSRPVPFRNMIYIGDGMTDVPCMRLVKEYGGYSIAVYGRKHGRETAEKLLHQHRVNFAHKADYRKDSALFLSIGQILKKMAAEETLVNLHRKQLAEKQAEKKS